MSSEIDKYTNPKADSFLQHYGVKGMKWGVSRKSSGLNSRAKGNTDRMVAEDKARFGRRGSKRINKNMNKGKTRAQAQKKEVHRAMVKGAAVVSTYAAIRFAPQIARAMQQPINKAEKFAGDKAFQMKMKDGMKKANKMMADNRGITNYQTVSLAYDTASKMWK